MASKKNKKLHPSPVGDFSRLDLSNARDRERYRLWEESLTMSQCKPDEELVHGYWTAEGYHHSYCRKKEKTRKNRRK